MGKWTGARHFSTGLSFANGMITTGISNGWEYSAGEIVGIAASSIVSGILGGRQNMMIY